MEKKKVKKSLRECYHRYKLCYKVGFHSIIWHDMTQSSLKIPRSAYTPIQSPFNRKGPTLNALCCVLIFWTIYGNTNYGNRELFCVVRVNPADILLKHNYLLGDFWQHSTWSSVESFPWIQIRIYFSWISFHFTFPSEEIQIYFPFYFTLG